MPFVNDPNAPGGRRWVEPGQGVETLDTQPVLNWNGVQTPVPATAPATSLTGPLVGEAPANNPPAAIPYVPERNTPMIPGTGDRSTRGEALAADTLNWGGVPGSYDWFHNLLVRGGNIGTDIENWLGEPNNPGGATPQAPAATTTPATPLDLNAILPEDQEWIDQLTQLYAGVGQGSPIVAPRLPQPTEAMFTPDPGNQVAFDHATRRQGQVDELLEELRAGREEEVNRRTSKWATFGRWLGEVSAVDDLSQGGRLMTQVLAENDDMRRDLRDETLQLIQMGWSAEDAVVQAQAQLLSGQAESQRALATAQFGRDTSQTGLDFQASIAEGQRTSQGAGQRLNAGVAIAEATREARRATREREDRVLGLLSENPQYSDQAFGAMAENLTTDPATQGAIVSTTQERQLNSALMNYVGQYAGSDNRQALQFLQQWDRRLTKNDLESMTPQQLMMRLTASPTARAAFAANRDYLLRSQQFGAMAPAQ